MNNLTGLTISAPLFFKENGDIDYKNLEKYLCDICKNRYIAAVYSMAYNTRYRMLDDHELFDLNRMIIELVTDYGHDVYVGHPYSFNERTLSRYLSKISQLNVAGISMLYPERYYGIYHPIIDFLKFPGKFNLPVVLHEMKLVSGFNGELMNWPLGLLDEVFDEIGLVGVKEDSKDDEIAEYILNKSIKKNFNFILAGGGKRRAIRFLPKGLKTWLNGSTMFLPALIDKIYFSVMNGNMSEVEFYIKNIEEKFFDLVVSKYGWHLSHKLALEAFGYGERKERFPHAELPRSVDAEVSLIFDQIKKAAHEFGS